MGSVALDFERTVDAPAAEVRRELCRALVELGFKVTSEQLTLIEARRGSHAAGAVLGTGRMPVAASAALSASESGGCRVAVHLEDRVIHPAWGMTGQYQQIFASIRSRLDAALAGLDPASAAGFAEPRFTASVGRVPFLDSANRIGGDIQEAAVGRVNRILGGGSAGRVPDAWRQLDAVLFRASEGAALLQPDELQAHLAIAVLISSQPGCMPAPLAGQVEAFAARVEAELGRAGSSRRVEIAIADAERPVLEFLHQQARLRERLPVRTLHRCRACRFERVTNPDLERLQRRNRRLRALGTSVGATLGRHGISPFVLVGSIFRLADLDPEYVCPRCQGTDAEAMVVTFCPGCGDLRPEAALRSCAKCGLDLRSTLSAEAGIWGPHPPLQLPPPAPAALPEPPAGTPLGVCSICGSAVPVLWRAVVAVPGGSRELLVCGRPPACAPHSLVAPTQV